MLSARAVAPQSRLRELLAVLDTLPAVLILWDPERRVLYGNHKAALSLGTPADRLRGMSMADVVGADVAALSRPYFERALDGTPQQFVHTVLDPAPRHVQITYVPNYCDGALVGVLSINVDVTTWLDGLDRARTEAEQAALLDERRRITTSLDAAVLDTLSSALADLSTKVERSNDPLPVLDSVVEAVDRTITELRAAVESRMINPTAGTPQIAPYPRMSVPPDTPTRLSATAAPTGWRAPATSSGEGWTDRDVIAVLDQIPVVITTWNAEAVNTFANRAALHWYDRTDRDQMVGQHALDVLGSEVYEANLPYIADTFAGVRQNFERSVLHPRGVRHTRVWYTPMLDDQAVTGIYCFTTDITSRVTAEEELLRGRARVAAARERARISDDLHNLVIQRLFAAGLTATAAGATASVEVGDRLRSVRESIENALAELEKSLQRLQNGAAPSTLLRGIARIVEKVGAPGTVTTRFSSVGSVEFIPPAVGEQMLTVLADALRDVVARGDADAVEVTVAADVSGVWLRVADNGRHATPAASAMELRGIADRAQRLGGTCTWTPASPRGTVLDWRVPTGD
jgi:signal transduction histidine kinase